MPPPSNSAGRESRALWAAHRDVLGDGKFLMFPCPLDDFDMNVIYSVPGAGPNPFQRMRNAHLVLVERPDGRFYFMKDRFGDSVSYLVELGLIQSRDVETYAASHIAPVPEIAVIALALYLSRPV